MHQLAVGAQGTESSLFFTVPTCRMFMSLSVNIVSASAASEVSSFSKISCIIHILSAHRVFMWGAKSGEEQLPPFPEPTHNGIRNGLGDKWRHCIVNFTSEASKRNAHPLVSTTIMQNHVQAAS